MSKGKEPPPPDYEGMQAKAIAAGERQTVNNRPNMVNPYSSTSWSTGPDGRPVMTTSLDPGLKAASDSAISGVAGMGNLDLSRFGNVGTGDSAREQAISGAYSQALRRLNPQFSQLREGTKTNLLNQGLTPGSEAYEREITRLGHQQNDAYGGAMSSAIAQGTIAGDTALRGNIAADQYRAGLAQTQYNAPLQRLQAVSGFLNPQSFNADNTSLQAQGMANGYGIQGAQDAYQRWDAKPGFGDYLGAGLGAAAGIGGMFLSDERAKTDVTRLSVEAMPGVPFASFRYVDGLGPPGLHYGVIAQDLEMVAPRYVHRRPDGLMEVDYSWLTS